MSKITKLQAENVKRIKAVEITPDGEMVVVGGANGAGKSSVLDSIMYAMAGKRAICDRPIRNGEERGEVTVTLDSGLVVKRTFTPGGGSLSISNGDGAVFRQPQAILDKLTGQLTFDPLDFCRMDARAQRESLKDLLGLDFSGLDDQRARAYEERREANARVKALTAQIEAAPHHEDAPAEMVSVSELMKELEAGRDLDTKITKLEELIASQGASANAAQAEIEKADAQIAKWQAFREKHEKSRDQSLRAGEENAAARAKFQRPDMNAIMAKVRGAAEVNEKVKANAQREILKKQRIEATAESQQFQATIEQIDADKAKALADADFPVDGLSFDSEQVLYRDVPFSQASSAEQLRVSMGMAAAANPDLRVMLIRDGSLLDEDSLRLVAEFAAERDFQVWLEVVREDEACSVVIEDGAVRAAQPKQAIPAVIAARDTLGGADADQEDSSFRQDVMISDECLEIADAILAEREKVQEP